MSPSTTDARTAGRAAEQEAKQSLLVHVEVATGGRQATRLARDPVGR
jgi:hypothetical protein